MNAMSDILKEPSKFDLVVTQGLNTQIHKELCDRCRGTNYAKVRAFKVLIDGFAELYFCGHCIRKYSMMLSLQGFEIEDPKHALNYEDSPDPYTPKDD